MKGFKIPSKTSEKAPASWKNTHAIIPESQVPFYGELRNFDWVGDYLKIEKYKDELLTIRKERAELQKKLINKDDMLACMKESYSNYTLEAAGQALRYIKPHQIAPSDKMLRGLPQDIEPLLPFSFFEQVVGLLPEGEISLAKRDKLLKELKNKKTAILGKIAALTPAHLIKTPTHFMWGPRGRVPSDIRTQLVEFWEFNQGLCQEPVGVRCFALKTCEQSEQKAWADLNLKLYVNKLGKLGAVI